MPPFRCLTALSLLALVLPAGGALAQSWVDPPARAAAPAKSAPSGAAPANAAPANAVPGKAAPEAAGPARSAAQAPAPAEAAAKPPAVAETRTAATPATEAERQTDRAAVRRTERHRRPHRLADTPPAAPDSLPPAAKAAPPATAALDRPGGWAGTAQGLAADYFDAISTPGGTMVSVAPRFYRDRIRFYGRTMSLADLLAEKRRFAQRWPERRYAPRGMRTLCNGALATCTVHAQVAFRAASPGRGAVSQGVAEVVLEVSLAGPRPVIVSETGRILSRGGNLSALAQPAGGA